MSMFPDNSMRRPAELGYESREQTMTVAQFFNTVYAWMCVGLALTAVVAWYVASSGMYRAIYASKGGYLFIALAAFGIAWYAQSQAGRLSTLVVGDISSEACACSGDACVAVDAERRVPQFSRRRRDATQASPLRKRSVKRTVMDH